MNPKEAWEILKLADDQTLSQLGVAVSTLFDDGKSYKEIAKTSGRSEGRISAYHKVASFPKNLQWLTDQNVFPLSTISQIARLSDTVDKELLAFSAFSKKLSSKDVKEVVDVVVKHNRSVREVLETLIGIRYDKVDDPILLPFSFEDKFKISIAAWAKGQRWEDFCYNSIMGATRVNASENALKIIALAEEIHNSSETPFEE